MKKILNVILILMIGGLMINIGNSLSLMGYRKVADIAFIIVMLIMLFMQEIQEYIDKRKILNAGVEGESRVKEVLKGLDKKRYKVLHGFYLKGTTMTQEIDSLVISNKCIFNIECKNFGGKITIDKNGIWHRVKYDKEEILKSPIEQVNRHHKVLEEVVGKNIKIVDIIVISNERTTIHGEENISIPVIKHDELLGFISKYNNTNEKYSIKELSNKISSKIKGYSDIKGFKEKNNKVFYKNWDFILKLIIIIYLIIYYFKE